jgi:hypothetical protein
VLGRPEAQLRPIVPMGRVPARNTTSGGCEAGRSLSGGGGGGRWRRKVGRRAPAAAWAAPPQTSMALAPLPPAQALAALAPPPSRWSAAPARLLHRARRGCALAPPAPPAASHSAVLCQHGWRHGLPRRACTASPSRRLAAAGGAGSPSRGLPWRATLAPPSSGTEEARKGGSGTKEGRRRDKEGRELGFGRRSHRFIYRRAKWASWAVGRRASPWAASCRLISCCAGPALWAENEAQPSPTSCSCRPGPKKSCWARARVGPKNRAMGWPIGLVLNGHV